MTMLPGQRQEAWELMVYEGQDPDESLATKRSIASEVVRRALIDENVLRAYPTLYVGARIDLMYPLVLGARELIMLDPCYRMAESLKVIQEGAERIARGLVSKPSPTSFSFDFAYGEAAEPVLLRCEAVCFAPATREELVEEGYLGTEAEWRDYEEIVLSAPAYMADEPLGMILLFKSGLANLARDGNTLAQLVPGGYVLSDWVGEGISTEDLMQSECEVLFSKASAAEKQSVLERAYDRLGFDFITLNDHPELSYTFLRKR